MPEALETRRPHAPLSVGVFVREVSDAIGQRFGTCSVQGELSAWSRAASGHCYFTLKDVDGSPALIRCAMFRRAASLTGFAPADGQLVEVRGRLGVYEPRGELQLVVESMQRAGAGLLLEQFLRLKLRLQAEGLFDASRKRALPLHPRSIGLVTSLGGAVLHDVVTTLKRRAPHVSVIVYPSLVQGPGAPTALCAAVAAASARAEVDVLLICRGGGSLEDLRAFNDEQVVRAIAAAPMPVLSGVGHETDVSLVDFVADLRAATPTAAAEVVALPVQVCQGALDAAESNLRRRLRERLDVSAQRLDRLSMRLVAPAQRLGQQSQRLGHLEQRLRAGTARALKGRRVVMSDRDGRWRRAVAAQLLRDRQCNEHLGARLRALDPARVLARGYAWLADDARRPVMSVRHIAPGDRLSAVLTDGSVAVQVESVEARGADRQGSTLPAAALSGSPGQGC